MRDCGSNAGDKARPTSLVLETGMQAREAAAAVGTGTAQQRYQHTEDVVSVLCHSAAHTGHLDKQTIRDALAALHGEGVPMS